MPSVAVIVAVSPLDPPASDTVGVVSFVTLSESDAPVSLALRRSGTEGDGAVESIVKLSGDDGGDTFPDGSVMAAVDDQLPGVNVGKSHDVASPIV